MSASAADLAAEVDALRRLMQPDGADLEVIAIDPASGRVELRLILEGASCADCVMPRDLLEAVFRDRLRRTVGSVTAVTVDDPREREQGGRGAEL